MPNMPRDVGHGAVEASNEPGMNLVKEVVIIIAFVVFITLVAGCSEMLMNGYFYLLIGSN